MERRVIIHPSQQVTDGDLNNIGEFARASLDHAVHDGIEPGRKFWGFPVTVTGPLEITVGEGRFYAQGRVFYRSDEGGIVINLADYIPVVTKRIVTVVVWGNQTETAIEPRTFLIDAETGQTEAEAVATESRRFAEINVVPGTENANPQPSPLDMNVIAVAYVTLTPAGVESVQMVEANRLNSVASNHQKITDLQAWRSQAGTRLDTLGTDVANLAHRLTGTVNQRELFEVAADVARVKRALDFGDDLSSYGQDPFLDLRDSDPDHPDWLVKVEEGARFPYAQQRVANINLLNPLEERVTQTGSFALPAYVPAERISVTGRDGEIPISQYSHQSVELKQKTMTRMRVRYGSYQIVCTNAEWWKTGQYDPVQGIFKRGDEEWEVSDYGITHPTRFDSAGRQAKWVRMRQIFYDYVEEAYWENVVVTDTVSGSVIAQSFLNSQDGWLTHIDLWFTQVAGSGVVHALITETTNGAPDLRKVIGRVTVNQEDLKTYPQETRIPFTPTFLKKGERYAIVLITQGAHMVAFVEGNKFAEGSLFYSTDGAWFQGDLVRDLAMRILFAEFATTRVEVQIEAFELANGIANIDILAESFTPGGCDLIFEIQINGVWRPLQYYDTNILVGLPPLLPARIVFLGTTDLMPGIKFGAASTVTTFRPRTDFKHVSATRTLPGPVDVVEVRTRLEGWDDERHTFDCELLTGTGFSTVVTADSYEDRATEDPEAIERRFYFELGAPISAYKIRMEGTTDNALVTFHVAERVDVSRATP